MRGVDWVLYLPAGSIEQAAGGRQAEGRWIAFKCANENHLYAKLLLHCIQNECRIGSEAARQLGQLQVGKVAVRCHQATRPYKMWRERARKTFFHANDAYLPVPTTLPLPYPAGTPGSSFGRLRLQSAARNACKCKRSGVQCRRFANKRINMHTSQEKCAINTHTHTYTHTQPHAYIRRHTDRLAGGRQQADRTKRYS